MPHPLGYKEQIVLGTWNVCPGLADDANLITTQTAAIQNGIDILSIQEAGKPGRGMQRVHRGHTLPI